MKTLLSFVVLTIFTTNTITAQESTITDPSKQKAVSEESFVLKMNPNSKAQGQTITDLNTNRNTVKEESVIVYPNPTTELLNISFNSNSQASISIEIYDVFGKKMVEERFNAQIGSNVHSIFVSRLKNGLYYMNLKNENGVITHRFTKN